jgi:hypothetical protein
MVNRKSRYPAATPESFMQEQAGATSWFIFLIGVWPILCATTIVLASTNSTLTRDVALGIGAGIALTGVIVGLIYRRHYLKMTAGRVLLLATPEPTKSSLTDLRAVVESVESLIKEYENRTTNEIERFEIQTAQLSALLAEAQSNEERLAAALNQMQKILGLKEGSEAVDSEVKSA